LYGGTSSLYILRASGIEFPPDFTVFLLILTGFSWNFSVFMDHNREDVAERKRGGGIPKVLQNDRKMARMGENGRGGGAIFITPNFGG